MGYEIEIGDVLDRRFRITGLLSNGGMANVFRALDLSTLQEFAVKVPLMRYEMDPTFFNQFQREEAIAASLDHPTVIRTVKLDRSARSRPYLVTELLQGRTLDALIQDGKPVDLAFAIPLICRLCDALHYVHGMGVVHRDLKPGNIMCCADGGLRILDFGLAATPADKRSMASGLGTLVYMAPEQVRGKRPDARVDVYALGSILYELATGKRPFPMEDQEEAAMARVTGDPVAPRQLNPQISLQIEEIVLRAVARDPDRRYPTCAAFKHDLEQPEHVEVTGLAARLTPPRPHRPLTRIVFKWLALAAIPLLVFTLLYVVGHHR